MKHALNLSHLNKGEKAKVTDLILNSLPSKVYDLGILPGTIIEMFSKAPFNGPLCFSIGTTHNKLALRKEEAQLIFVEKL